MYAAGPAMSLAEIIETEPNGGYNYTKIQFENNSPVSCMEGEDEQCTQKFGEMFIWDSYEEKNLLSHSILNSEP